jgi:tRNA nucleotidyltransferase/poly(A) polymerase
MLFTFLEPASTSEVTFWQRLFIWTLQISILVPSLIVFHILLQLIPVFDRLNDWFKILLSGLMGCLFFMPFSLSIDYVMGLDDWSQVQNLAQAKDIIFEEIGGVFPPALLTWAAMNAPRILQLNFSNTELNAKVEKSSLEVTSENIKNGIKTLNEAKKNYNYYNKQKNINQELKENNLSALQLKIKDYKNINNNENSYKSNCKDKLKLEISIYDNKQELIKKQQIEVILGSKQNEFLEQIASNLSSDNWRLAEVPIGYKTNDTEIDNLLQTKILEYRITILDLTPNFSPQIICN